MADFEKVLKVGDLQPGEMVKVEVALNGVLLGNVDGKYFAVGNTCTHAELPILDDKGSLDGNEAECPYHGSVFDVTTGKPTQGPASFGLQLYSVRVEGDDILVGPA
ncbi:MAG: Rieske 2Fe-2S domain-containing protein [SAR202 cluster bacterium]|jgi:nitrite reductase/ring-hydroxylating ferredoxin subunit|nr:Rieske 2Fe-2S domain-containing protein [SAR202 cluster bacterium]|tara:strand:- start:1721 stop:2038 length:318 start_codon:yes stop_codon:yes gene_type:complete